MRELKKQEDNSSDDMRKTYFDHPSSDLLEKFVLGRCTEDELDLVEPHILACHSCVSVLEGLEDEVASIKTVFGDVELQSTQAVVKPVREKIPFWNRLFSVPNLSWAGAGLAAAALLSFALIPANIQLQAERGEAKFVVPEWRPSHVHLADAALPEGRVAAEVADQNGTVLWSQVVADQNGGVDLNLPRFTHAGIYYARLYTADKQHDLLEEFPFDVQWKL